MDLPPRSAVWLAVIDGATERRARAGFALRLFAGWCHEGMTLFRAGRAYVELFGRWYIGERATEPLRR